MLPNEVNIFTILGRRYFVVVEDTSDFSRRASIQVRTMIRRENGEGAVLQAAVIVAQSRAPMYVNLTHRHIAAWSVASGPGGGEQTCFEFSKQSG